MYEPKAGWQWDMNQIKQAKLSNDVVILMTSKLKKYPQNIQSALNMGGILGAEFQVEMACLGLNQTPDDTYKALLPAIQDGLLKELPDRLKFAHDKIHESSYALLPRDIRIERHALIAQYMLNTLDEVSIDAEIFTIVEHLNNSVEENIDPEKSIELAKFNYQAGIKAKQSSAFEPAVDFFLQARNYLNDSIWQEDPQFAFDLYFALAQAAYTTAKFQLSEQSIKLCMLHEKDQIKITPIIQLYQDLLFADSRHEEGIEFALTKLKEYGQSLPHSPSMLSVFLEYLSLKIRQRLRPTEKLLFLPKTTDQKRLSIMAIIANMVPSCYMANSNLMGFISLRMASLSLKYGNNSYSSFGYAMTGLVETGIFKRIKGGRAYYDLSYQVEEKYPNKLIKGRNMMLMSSFAGPWTEPIADYKKLLEPARALNAEQGILQWSDFCVVFTRAQSLFFGRDTLENTQNENEIWLNFHIKNGDQQVIANQRFILHFIQKLRMKDTTEPPFEFDEEQHAVNVRQQQNVTFKAYYAVLKQFDHYMKGEFKESINLGLSLFTTIYEIYGIGLDAIHRYIFCLAYLAIDKRTLTPTLRVKATLYFRLNKFYLKIYQSNRPENYSAFVSLVDAEEYRQLNKPMKALNCYEHSLMLSEDTSLFNEALVNERLADFHQTEKHEHSALMYAARARKLYKRWGNKLQIQRIDKRYPELALISSSESPVPTQPITTEKAQDTLDLISLTRGSQAISSEVQLDQLINTLLKQLIQTAGAERAVLLIEEYGQLHIQGEIFTEHDQEQVNVLTDKTLSPNSNEMAESVIRFVERSKTYEVLSDACNTGNFTQDPYIIEQQLKSLLCMPILNQGKLLGILYLENNLMKDAFTQQHQDVLQILASQAAISLANAQLYSNLEEKVAERTQALESTMEQLIGAEKLASLGQLVSGIAHEINTPVGVGVTSSTLIQHELKEITKKFKSGSMRKSDFEQFLEHSNDVLEMLLKSINHIAELVDTFKQVEVSQSEEEKNHFNLKDYIQEILNSNSADLRNHPAKLNCPENIEMHSYPLAFSLIMNTLISNSLIHGFKDKANGSISIHVSQSKSTGNDNIIIEYIDDGVGITVENRKKIFDPFFTTNMGSHTGLGLHIIYNIVTQQFRGTIRCDAPKTPDHTGAYFYLSLPREA